MTPIRKLESKCIVSSELIVWAVRKMPYARLTRSCSAITVATARPPGTQPSHLVAASNSFSVSPAWNAR